VIETEPFSLALARPLATARGEIERREGVRVRASVGGSLGAGEATPLPGWTESLEECRAALDRAADSADEGAIAALADLDPGAVPAARHGLSLAVADARARRRGVPLYRHLGATDRVESVPVNATVGDGDVESAVADAREAVAAGYRCLKLKVGARSLSADADRVAAVRAACPEVALRADANGAWDRPTARRALDRLADHGVTYVEQPLPAGDIEGLAALRGGPVGVALDESLADRSVGACLAAGAADVVVLKPMVLGGPDRAVAAARRARGAGVEPVVTTTIDAVYARTAAVHAAAAIPDVPPCGLATADRFAEDLAADPAPVAGGAIAVPEGKGNVPGCVASRSA
jgi:o-succinylbenzoate synthase